LSVKTNLVSSSKNYSYIVIKLVWTILLIFAGFMLFSPFVNISELAYPRRIDSTYVKLSEKQILKELGDDSSKVKPDFYYLPSQLGLSYKSFTVHTCDSVDLKAWFISTKENPDAATLIILHDINESKISLLASAKQFIDRGFNVCLVDMRAHGESTGLFYTLGNAESKDITLVIDSIYPWLSNKNMAVMGIGLGANTALMAAHADKRIKCIIAQSPTDSLLDYVKRFAYNKWSIGYYPLFGMMKRQLENIIGNRLENINMAALSDCMDTPTMFIVGAADEITPAADSRKVFDECIASNKEYWPVKRATHYNIIDLTGENYFNRISVFLVKAMPKKLKKSRFRKLV
jgi:pimeloyl-ACP methyl ester carboxylesterase